MKVGLVYDPIYLEHDTGDHVENAVRLEKTLELLEKSGVKQQLVEVAPEPASVEDLLSVHSSEHIARIEDVAKSGGGWLDADTVVSTGSYQAALYAAGGVLKATEAVMNGKVDSAFALVRPPGHHATRREAMGFCLFNNIAIAARQSIRKHDLNRVLIVDFDVHHGNGTQDTFYSDPRVLYFSVHQHPLYPGTGKVGEVGLGEGQDTIVNVPLPPWCGDDQYLQVFQQILIPAARRFKPEIIMVSAGYDAHWADEISLMQVTISGFSQMASILKHLASELCQGRLVFALEGGYHISALAYSVKATLEILQGKLQIEDPLGKSAYVSRAPEIKGILQEVKTAHKLG